MTGVLFQLGASVWHGLDGFEAEAAGQCAYFESRSPSHAALLRLAAALLAEDGEVREAVQAAWRCRSFRARYERPLLLCAALRFDALRDPAHPLAAALGREPPDRSVIQAAAVRDALLRPTALSSMRERSVQTNEVTRACVWRWPLGLIAQGRPWLLADVGCSAGLNLIADRLELTWTHADGAPLELRPARIVGRVGFDRAPVDVRDPQAVDWLRACLWPGQAERLRRLELAVQCARDALVRGEMRIDRADATDIPAQLQRLTSADNVVFAYQTVVLDYLLPTVRDPYQAGMREWLMAHPRRAFWAELERASNARSADRAEIRLHVARGARAVRTFTLAECDYHPHALDLNPAALTTLALL